MTIIVENLESEEYPKKFGIKIKPSKEVTFFSALNTVTQRGGPRMRVVAVIKTNSGIRAASIVIFTNSIQRIKPQCM